MASNFGPCFHVRLYPVTQMRQSSINVHHFGVLGNYVQKQTIKHSFPPPSLFAPYRFLLLGHSWIYTVFNKTLVATGD